MIAEFLGKSESDVQKLIEEGKEVLKRREERRQPRSFRTDTG